MTIKFQKHFVIDGTTKARVNHSVDNRYDHRVCVTLYAKSFDDGDALGKLFAADYRNETDLQSDYFDKGSVTAQSAASAIGGIPSRYGGILLSVERAEEIVKLLENATWPSQHPELGDL